MIAHINHLVVQIMTNFYLATGLLGIVLAMAIESCGFPLYSEVIMPVAGVMVAAKRPLPGIDPSWPLWVSVTLVSLAGALGCLVGAIAAYEIGRVGGRPLVVKYGKFILLSEQDIDQADRFFHRWGSLTTFFSRLLPVLRTYISFPAGMAKMSLTKFSIYTFLGSFPWCFALAYAGAILRRKVGSIDVVFRYIDGLVLIIVVLSLAFYLWNRLGHRRRAQPDSANLATPNEKQGAHPH